MEADKRAQKGLFLAFQYPHAVPGVTVELHALRDQRDPQGAHGRGRSDPNP